MSSAPSTGTTRWTRLAIGSRVALNVVLAVAAALEASRPAQAIWREGRVFCPRCESLDCAHAAPPSPTPRGSSDGHGGGSCLRPMGIQSVLPLLRRGNRRRRASVLSLLAR